MEPKGIGLLQRALGRLMLINGPDEKCCMDPSVCPNHSLIHDIEEFLTVKIGK